MIYISRDEVEFSLGARDLKKPAAIKMKVLKMYRSSFEVEDIVEGLWVKIGEDPSVAEAVAKCGALMPLILSHPDVNYKMKFLAKLFKSLENFGNMGSLETFCTETNLLESILISDIIDDKLLLEDILTIFHIGAKQVPKMINQAFELLEKISNPTLKSTWAMKFLQLSMSQMGLHQEGEWRRLPIIPSVDEMLGTPLENDANLSPVKRKGAYR